MKQNNDHKTLRDEFAMAALTGLIAKDAAYARSQFRKDNEGHVDDTGKFYPSHEEVYDDTEAWFPVAKGAYALADAMLEIRNAPTPPADVCAPEK